MRLIRGLHNLHSLAHREDSPLAQGCVATIGNFDGVHRGHQVIIEQVRERAQHWPYRRLRLSSSHSPVSFSRVKRHRPPHALPGKG